MRFSREALAIIGWSVFWVVVIFGCLGLYIEWRLFVRLLPW